MKLIRSILAGLFASAAVAKAEPLPAKNNPSEMMKSMRLMWLTKVSDEDRKKPKDEVLAVLMDWPLGDKVVTVLSSTSGDASLYTTSTFGIMGGIGHENIRKAAMAFVSTAQRHQSIASPVNEFPYPDTKSLYFYLVTPSGVRRITCDITDIEKSGTPACVLYSASQSVVTELRLTTTK